MKRSDILYFSLCGWLPIFFIVEIATNIDYGILFIIFIIIYIALLVLYHTYTRKEEQRKAKAT